MIPERLGTRIRAREDDVVWEVATVSAPILRQQIDAWLAELG
jgi:hypothetical protein